MATAPSVTYRVASGASVNAGRFPGGRATGTFVMDDNSLSGSVSGSPPLGDSRIAIIGQSNAVGSYALRSDLSTSPLSSDAGLATYNSGTFSRVYILNAAGTAYQQLQMGTNQQAFQTDHFGPEFAIAVRWMRETTARLFIDKIALGGQYIAQFQPGDASGMYTRFDSGRANGDAWLASNGFTVTDLGIAWIQGEADAGADQASYLSQLNTLVGHWVSDGLYGGTQRLALGQMFPGTALYGAGVAAAKVAYQAANPTTSSVVPFINRFYTDNLHLNARGQMQLGYDCYEYLMQAAHIDAP